MTSRDIRRIGPAVVVLELAQSKNEPRWDPKVKGATRHLDAWTKRHEAAKR